MALTDEVVKSFIRKVEDGFNKRDPKQFEELLADHLIDHSVLLGGVDLRQRIARVQAALPDSKYKVREYMIEGSAVAWRWSISGTHKSDIMGIAPTGGPVTINGLSVAVVEHNKVVQQWEFVDYTAFLKELQGEAA
jgi:predicted ester cyclase